MTRRRWIADEVSGNQAALIGQHAEHLARVLRVRVGQSFDLVAGESVRRAVVTSVDEGRVEFELGEEVTSFPLSKVTLLMAIFKFDRMEWAIEKCTELGIAGIVPVVARRTDAHLASAAGNRVPRWERIVLQASEQSRRVSVPRIAEPSKLKDAVRDATGTRILLSESEKKLSLQEAVETHSSSETLLLAVGPEGGWTDDEFVIFAQCGWVAASLGSTILRAETAAIAATAIAMSALS